MYFVVKTKLSKLNTSFIIRKEGVWAIKRTTTAEINNVRCKSRVNYDIMRFKVSMYDVLGWQKAKSQTYTIQ